MSANLMSLAQSGGKFLKLYGDRKMVRTLPYKRRLAYLESHGSEYVDTGVRLDVSSDVVTVATTLSAQSGDAKVVWTASWTEAEHYTDRIVFFGKNTAIRISLWITDGSATYSPFGIADPGVMINAVADYVNSVVRFNELTYAIGKKSRHYKTINIFNSTSADVRVGMFKVNRGGTDIISLIPVMSFDDKPCFYDEVSGQLFYNQGTGEFTWGELDSQTT